MDQESLYCTHCKGISPIEELQEVQRLPQPRTLDNIEPSIYCPSSPGYDDVSIRKKPDYKGSFKSLSEEGLKIKKLTS